jgi:hypothetical protein
MAWQYKVVYADFRGRVSVEGDETFIEKNERRSSFARRVMNELGAEGWELVGIQPLWPVETAYLIFKKEGVGESAAPQGETGQQSEAPTTRLDPEAAQTVPPTAPDPAENREITQL